MLIEVNGKFLEYRKFTFPDGQPHIELLDQAPIKEVVVITAELNTPADVFDLLLLDNILQHGENDTHLRISWLMGGRMDRRIDSRQPNTLSVVAKMLNTCAFTTVEILDPHSAVTLEEINGSTAVYPFEAVEGLLDRYDPWKTVIIIPDEGATSRVTKMVSGAAGSSHDWSFVQCKKHRDSQTGRLSGFEVLEPEAVVNTDCLIIDDICDGGGTFEGVARALENQGANNIDLFVTHGKFTKGLPLKGIREVFTLSHSLFSWPGKLRKASKPREYESHVWPTDPEYS